ncbi:uncharacterized protein LOC120520234 isoform X2 [Polypterus senegalus]|uniref:uncharacterized protein LOC120520234 isoform X2 n=1 Tax=Polypterus senegalus TaxID=55291 RepID=UPI001965B532|nr:uncharacterized protein LOC120520234 isoform X2 [Polypterus senegalus]
MELLRRPDVPLQPYKLSSTLSATLIGAVRVPGLDFPGAGARFYRPQEGKRRSVRSRNGGHAVDFVICKCNLDCRASGHFHCIQCAKTLLRKHTLTNHLKLCWEKWLVVEPLSPSHEGTLPTGGTPASPLPASPKPTLPARSRHSALSSKESVQCPHCLVALYRRNLRLHIQRKHLDRRVKDITQSCHLPSECLDGHNGIFAVGKSFHGPCSPLHVKRKTWGSGHQVVCESEECRKTTSSALTMGMMAYQCDHVRSVDYCTRTAPHETLAVDTLNEILALGWIEEGGKGKCLEYQEVARSANAPLAVYVSIARPSHRKCISVYEPCMAQFSRLGRVFVIYDMGSALWQCPCSKPAMACPHKDIAKWHLLQTQRELFESGQDGEGRGSIYRLITEEHDYV